MQIYNRFYTEAYADYYGHITATPHEQPHERLPASLLKRLEQIAATKPLAGARLLELGPGGGLFLYGAQQQGATVLGIEPSEQFYRNLCARNIPCIQESLEDVIPEQLDQMDIIAMFHVLEHFYDPNEALQKCRTLLHQDGILVIEVPNVLKPFRSLDRFFFRYVHPSNFSPQTLDAMLAKHGFKVCLMDTGGSDWLQPQSLFVVARKQEANAQEWRYPQQRADQVIEHLQVYARHWWMWGMPARYACQLSRYLRRINRRVRRFKTLVLHAISVNNPSSHTHIVQYSHIPKHYIACACCGSEEYLPACQGDRYGFGLQTVVCCQCGFIFTNPRPTDEWFAEFYRYHYRHYYESVEVPDEAYLQRDWICGRHRRNLDMLVPLLSHTGRLLDIGCAEGTFLHIFQQQFPAWRVQGIEPSEQFSAFARSYYHLEDVHTCGIEALHTWPTQTFDLITASHVLEHLLHPESFFVMVRRLLNDNGLLFLDVPDAEHCTKHLHNIHIGHVYHFTEQSIRNFCTKYGFHVEHVVQGNGKAAWTLQVVARKQSSLPEHWLPPSVDSRSVARSFAKNCSLWVNMRRTWHSRFIVPLRRGAGKYLRKMGLWC
jgi:2-polyprenyl-3-methyl-5-hydroxy-6-metoxy-1,4-benzoquinol methylase